MTIEYSFINLINLRYHKNISTFGDLNDLCKNVIKNGTHLNPVMNSLLFEN